MLIRHHGHDSDYGENHACDSSFAAQISIMTLFNGQIHICIWNPSCFPVTECQVMFADRVNRCPCSPVGVPAHDCCAYFTIIIILSQYSKHVPVQMKNSMVILSIGDKLQFYRFPLPLEATPQRDRKQFSSNIPSILANTHWVPNICHILWKTLKIKCSLRSFHFTSRQVVCEGLCELILWLKSSNSTGTGCLLTNSLHSSVSYMSQRCMRAEGGTQLLPHHQHLVMLALCWVSPK